MTPLPPLHARKTGYNVVSFINPGIMFVVNNIARKGNSKTDKKIIAYSSAAGAAVVADAFLADAFFLGAAAFLVTLGAAVPLETRPDFVLVRTAGFSATAGAYETAH